MYAVIRTGGKQYKVQAGDIIKVEKLEKSLGDEFDMEEILFVSGKSQHVGEPTVANAKVTAVVTKQDKNKKILVFKKRRRQGYRKMKGHRQEYTELFIKMITAPDGESFATDKQAPIKDPSKKKEKVEAADKAEKKTAKKAAKKKTAKKTASKKKTAKKKTAKKATKKKATKKKA